MIHCQPEIIDSTWWNLIKEYRTWISGTFTSFKNIANIDSVFLGWNDWSNAIIFLAQVNLCESMSNNWFENHSRMYSMSIGVILCQSLLTKNYFRHYNLLTEIRIPSQYIQHWILTYECIILHWWAIENWLPTTKSKVFDKVKLTNRIINTLNLFHSQYSIFWFFIWILMCLYVFKFNVNIAN